MSATSPHSKVRRKGALLKAIGTSLLGLAAFVLVAEGALWAAAYWHDREVEPSLQNGVSDRSSNRQLTNLVFIGNSHTRGAGLPIHLSFPVQLNDLLYASGSSWRSLNFGRTNYNSTQIREALPGWMDQTHAKLVVAMLGEANLWNRIGQHGFISVAQSRSRVLNLLSLIWLRHSDAESRAWRALGVVEPNYRGPGNMAPSEWKSLYLNDLEILEQRDDFHPEIGELRLCRWKTRLRTLILELRADLDTHQEADGPSSAGSAYREALERLRGIEGNCRNASGESQDVESVGADAVARLLVAERLWVRTTQRLRIHGGENPPTIAEPVWLKELRESVGHHEVWGKVMKWMSTLGSLESLSPKDRQAIYMKALDVEPAHSLAAQLVLNELIQQRDWSTFMTTFVGFQKANPLSAQFAPVHLRNILVERAPTEIVKEFDLEQSRLLARRPEASVSSTELSEEQWKAWLSRDLRGILEIVRANGATLVVQGYPPYRNPLPDRPCRGLDMWLKEFAEQNGLLWLDTCAELQKSFAVQARKGLGRESFYLTKYGPHDDHLNERGYALVAEFVERELSPVLQRPESP